MVGRRRADRRGERGTGRCRAGRLQQAFALSPRGVASGKGLAAVRDALLDILPLSPEATDSNRIWVSSWDTALSDPDLSTGYARKYAQGRDRLTRRVAAAQELGELPPGSPADIAAAAQSFVLGLVVQVLFDQAAFPPQRQVKLLDDYLAALTASP
ncbi:TetR family transcriptional regulator C-terminal domain-containing protein [Streptomyces sp. NPDC049040]|uniref:TetR family transcriptional regulator C-terminal domain-containing protein n=1 Tax=Streptomyces sp. NPDC049040 TaxID=3365593 RepID=UPI00371005A9